MKFPDLKSIRPPAAFFAGSALIFLLGVALRFFRLGRQSLWQDEIHTVLYVNDHPTLAAVIHRVATWDLHSPLYYVLLRLQVGCQQMLGLPLNDGNLRLLSACLGSLALLAMALLCWQIYRSWGYVLFGMLLAAVNAYGIFYSQEIRMYALILLLAPLVLYFRARLWTGPEGRLALGPAIGYVVVSLLLLYSSLIGIFFVFGVWLSELLLNLPLGKNPRQRWIFLLGLGALILLGYLPWLGVMWRQSQLLKGGLATGLVILPPREVFKFAWENLLFHAWRVGAGYGLVNKIFRLLLVLSLLNLWDRERGQEHARMLLGFVCVFIVYFGLTYHRPFHTGRYFSPWWPFALYFCLAATSGLQLAWTWIWPKGKWIGAVMGLLLLIGYLWVGGQQLRYYFFSDYQKEDWRGSVAYLNAQQRPDEILVVTGDWGKKVLEYYSVKLPFIYGAELQAGRIPEGFKRFIYVGVKSPGEEMPGLSQNFLQQAWPIASTHYYLWLRP